MSKKPSIILIPADEMQDNFRRILLKYEFTQDRAFQIAKVFMESSLDGIYTHGVNRFPRFIQYVREGYVNIDAKPTLESTFHGMEQWNGNAGPGISNALHVTDTVMSLASVYGIGCVALKNTNHWMRGGSYGWHAAKAGYVFIGWTNTIANLPAWGAKDAKLGNNPLVIGLPFKDEAIVLDMAMSQYSYGALELYALKNEKLPVNGGFNTDGELTVDPSEILASNNPLPAGYWKGAGLALLLDLLSTILSGGISTSEISSNHAEVGVSQVFIAIDISKLGNHSIIAKTIENILSDYHQSVPLDESKKILYPGERVLNTRERNLQKGIPVLKKVWDEINEL